MGNHSRQFRHDIDNLSVRLASAKDITALRKMGRKFHDKAQPEWPWSDDGFDATIGGLIENGYVAMTRGGFIAGFIAPMPLNPSWRVAHEVLWFANDGKGAKLAAAFREWARSNRVDEIKWSCRSSNLRVKRHYEKFATPSENVYSEMI
jgi:hypothetical protein